ncbi:MAG: hypothetical protein ACJAQT_005199 [Akkermansiaceae bacterium]|jgi:hypothetical protein
MEFTLGGRALKPPLDPEQRREKEGGDGGLVQRLRGFRQEKSLVDGASWDKRGRAFGAALSWDAHRAVDSPSATLSFTLIPSTSPP